MFDPFERYACTHAGGPLPLAPGFCGAGGHMERDGLGARQGTGEPPGGHRLRSERGGCAVERSGAMRCSDEPVLSAVLLPRYNILGSL